MKDSKKKEEKEELNKNMQNVLIFFEKLMHYWSFSNELVYLYNARVNYIEILSHFYGIIKESLIPKTKNKEITESLNTLLTGINMEKDVIIKNTNILAKFENNYRDELIKVVNKFMTNTGADFDFAKLLRSKVINKNFREIIKNWEEKNY